MGWLSAHKVTWVLLLMLIAGAHSDVEEERFSEDESAEERSSKWYTGYTASTSGCPCWFDIQANDTRCACCQNGGIQCGYPKQDQCWHANKWGGVQRISRGCSGSQGVPHSVYTLSTTGFPCPWDPSDRSCSWCTVDKGWLCPKPKNIDGSGEDAQEQKTWRGEKHNVCISERNAKRLFRGGAHTSKCRKYDCSLYPDQCSADATCEEVEYLPGKNSNICVCKKGFTGNGIQCIEISSSSILPPAKESSTTEIDLKLTTELFLGPQGDNVTELSKDNFDKIQEFLDSGKPEDIADGSTCQVVASSNPTPESRLINSNQYRSLMVEASHGRF